MVGIIPLFFNFIVLQRVCQWSATIPQLIPQQEDWGWAELLFNGLLYLQNAGAVIPKKTVALTLHRPLQHKERTDVFLKEARLLLNPISDYNLSVPGVGAGPSLSYTVSFTLKTYYTEIFKWQQATTALLNTREKYNVFRENSHWTGKWCNR